MEERDRRRIHDRYVASFALMREGKERANT